MCSNLRYKILGLVLRAASCLSALLMQALRRAQTAVAAAGDAQPACMCMHFLGSKFFPICMCSLQGSHACSHACAMAGARAARPACARAVVDPVPPVPLCLSSSCLSFFFQRARSLPQSQSQSLSLSLSMFLCLFLCLYVCVCLCLSSLSLCRLSLTQLYPRSKPFVLSTQSPGSPLR